MLLFQRQPRLHQIAVFLVFVFNGCLAHVRLTYPEARFPDFDFLDNYRTEPPCGVPANPNLKDEYYTTLTAGSRINVTWFMSYVHKGGFRLELLDPTGKPLFVLTPKNDLYIETGNETQSSYEVTIPDNLECYRCSLRITRQASEWGENYHFYSCADVNVVKYNEYDKCSGHGEWIDGKCVCQALFDGPNCQYKDECWLHTDCGDNAQCIHVSELVYPKHVCYCQFGYFGAGCSRKSPFGKDFESSLYHRYSLGSFDTIYWRILQDSQEVEFVLKFASTSWVAIGWKDLGINSTCQVLPHLPPGAYGPQAIHGFWDRQQPEEPVVVEPDPGPLIPQLTTLVPVPEVEPGVEAEISAAPEIAVFTEPETTRPTPEVTAEPRPEPESSANTLQVEALLTVAVATTSKPIQPQTVAPYTEPQTQSPPNVHVQPVVTQEVNNIVTQQVTQVYTPPILPQTPPVVITDPPVVLTTTPSVQESTIFFKIPDVRGDVCFGEWAWPPNCIGSNIDSNGIPCIYRASWTYLLDTDEIEFSVESVGPSTQWTGIGFSKNGDMQNADMIMAIIDHGEVRIYDAYASSPNTLERDNVQNINAFGGTFINGVTRIGFTRPRATGDIAHDVQFGDTECHYFLFPIDGGLVTDGWADKLDVLPINSTVPVCIQPCARNKPKVQKQCSKEYKFPPGCTPPSCDYHAKWEFYPEQEDILFQITAKELGRWTGIGFSRDQNMTNSDIVVGWMYDGRAYITDRFAYGKHQPAIDSFQDIHSIGGVMDDNSQTIWFRRKIVTADRREDLPLLECLYFEFPVGGGRVLARTREEYQDKNTAIGYHDYYVPKISKDLICICTEDGEPLLLRKKRQEQGPPEPVPEHVHSEPSAEGTAEEPHPYGIADGHVRSEPEPGHAEPESESAAEPVNTNLHSMDCTDMVIGFTKGDMHRVGDYYSISRSTPRLDTFYGGTDSFTAAAAYEEDGVTTMMFRKPLKSFQHTDVSIRNAPMEFIWAKGQNGLPNSQNYYEPNVLMYHGGNRGHFTTNLYRGVPECKCCGRYSEGDQYSASWKPEQSNVTFTIETKITPGRWTGIGFSKTGRMSDADMIIIQVTPDSQVFTFDRFNQGYSIPTLEKDQNILFSQSNYVSGHLKTSFVRPIISPDKTTDIDLDECVYFLYATMGGQLGPDGEIMSHKTQPVVSSHKICLTKCQMETTSPPKEDSTTEQTDKAKPDVAVAGGPVVIPSKPQKKSYLIRIRFPHEKFLRDYNVEDSVAYMGFTKNVTKELNDYLSVHLKGYISSKVIRLQSGSVIAEMEIEVRPQVKKDQLEKAIKQFLQKSDNKIGSHVVDPEALVVNEKKSSKKDESLRNWIIIGVAAGLVLLSIIFVICLCIRSKKRKSKKYLKVQYPDYPLPASAYASYILATPYGSLPRSAYAIPYGPPPPMMEKGSAYENDAYSPEYHRPASAMGMIPGRPPPSSTPRMQPIPMGIPVYGDQRAASMMGTRREAELDGNGPDAKRGTETSFSDWNKRVSQADQDRTENDGATMPNENESPQGPRRRNAESELGARYQQPDVRSSLSIPPYVTYPGDPYGFYTIGGHNRLQRGPMPPPGYYGRPW